MKKHASPYRIFSLAGALLFSLLAVQAHGDNILIKDTFTNQAPDREPHDSLQGTRPGVGSGVWVSNTNYNNAVFSSENTIIANSTAESRIATPGLEGIVMLSVDMRNGGAWGGIGFLTSASSSSSWGWTAGQSPLHLRIQGQYWILEGWNGSSAVRFGEGNGGFSSTDFYILNLSWDTETLGVRVVINNSGGTGIVDSGWLSSVKTGLTAADLASIQAVGFRLQGSTFANEAAVSDFTLTTTAPIPESSSFAVLTAMLTVAALIFNKRRATV